jgi:methionine--tRNA ligase beta chain
MKPIITYSDFEKLDIRVGRVVSATAPEWSDKLLRYEVDLGEEIGNRVLFSGIRKWYTPEELIGKNIPVVINLAPKKMGDEESSGMCIMADTDDGAILIFLPEDLKPGSVIR